jgi:hypothetical protein
MAFDIKQGEVLFLPGIFCQASVMLEIGVMGHSSVTHDTGMYMKFALISTCLWCIRAYKEQAPLVIMLKAGIVFCFVQP